MGKKLDHEHRRGKFLGNADKVLPQCTEEHRMHYTVIAVRASGLIYKMASIISSLDAAMQSIQFQHLTHCQTITVAARSRA
jgi:hypothetical protein